MKTFKVKVDKFIFPIDFLILDMEEDKDVSLILGWPFLAIERTLIDVAAGELIMRVNNEQVIFNIFKAMEYPNVTNDYFVVNINQKQVKKSLEKCQFLGPSYT